MTEPALARLAAILAAGDGAPTAVPRALDAAAWDAVLAVAGPADLMPALWRPARTLGLVEPVPEPLIEALGDRGAPRHHPAAVLELAYRRNAARTQDLLDQLESVVDGFAALGIEVVALKGAAHVVGGTWPDPAERAMSDLDLLVDPGAARAARRHLQGLGYVTSDLPGEQVGDHHHLPPLRHPDRFGSIELHVQPLQRGWRPALDAGELWADARVRSWRGHRIGVPAPAHAAVISLVHGYLADLARYQAQVPLRMVHELWRFDRRSGPVDWGEVSARLDGIGWPSLVEDYRATVETLFADRGRPGWTGTTPASSTAARSTPGRVAARARLGVALALAERPELARAAAPWLRARSSLDEGRLRRHYGTAIEGRWALRLHHLSRQLPVRRRLSPVVESCPPTRPARPRALLITPELPDVTGNGLAMRASVALRALVEVADVTLVVIDRPQSSSSASSVEVAATRRRPPMGQAADPVRARRESLVEAQVERMIVYRPRPVDDPTVAGSWLAHEGSRARLAALEPLAGAARLAHPDAVAELAAELTDLDDGERPASFDLVHVLRLRLAPWAEPFASADVVVTVLDLDDDEVATHERLAATARERGEHDLAEHLAAEAGALGRLADWYAPRAAVVTVASPTDVAGVARHQPRRVEVVPNAATGPGGDPTRHPRRRPAIGDQVVLLLVGNFTYAPNRWAAETLVDEIRPTLATRLGRAVQVELVGAAPSAFDRFRSIERVHVAGHQATLDAAYAAADLVVLPLPAAGGTRIKVLEAFAHLVPVVATPGAVEGLGVIDGVHALVAEDVDGLVDACVRALADPSASRIRARQAWELASGHERSFVARQLATRVADWLDPAAPDHARPGAWHRGEISPGEACRG